MYEVLSSLWGVPYVPFRYLKYLQIFPPFMFVFPTSFYFKILIPVSIVAPILFKKFVVVVLLVSLNEQKDKAMNFDFNSLPNLDAF